MKLKSLLAMALLGATASLQAADVPVSGSITSNTTWTADNTYIMSGYVFVTNGATLTIEPGTVVKGQVSSGAGAAALIVTRSSKIMAEGTADQPIIFTSVLDNLDGSLGTERKGLWGGVILLGNAQINSRADGEDPGSPKQDQIEGVSVTTEQIPLVTFGGLDDADNSGVMKYVSIRHGGANLGAGNEINGLTLGGVGSGTVLSYIEVYANFDDGFEFFGGTVSPDHLVAAFCGDDSFDFDSGFRGTLQWLFTLQAVDGEEPGDKAIEWDGDTNPPTGTPVSSVTVSNLTAIGLGSTGGANAPINPRDNATVKLYNSAFINYARGIEIESDIGDVAPDIQSNVWWSHVAATNTAAGFGTSNSSGDLDATSYFTNAALNNVIVAPMMNGISYAKDAGLDPRPSSAESPLMTTPVFAADGLTATDYVGAFGTDLWIKGWTNLDIAGFLPAVLAAPDDAENADFVAPIVRGSTSKPSNVSTRGFVGTGLQSLTGGFVISGTQSQSVVIRAVGPTLGLAPFNLPGTLANVQIRLFSTSDPINPIAVSRVVTTQSITLGAELGAFALSAGAEDATIVATLAPGGYTAEVTGVDGATGIAIIEVYELD